MRFSKFSLPLPSTNINSTDMTTQEMKAFTVRIEPDEYEWLMGRAHLAQPKPNRIVRSLILFMRELLETGKADLRGYFTADEWGFMAQALQFLPTSTTDKNKVIEFLDESKLLIIATDLFPADISVIKDKILDPNFNKLHTLSLCESIRDYWDSYRIIKITDWAIQQATE